MTAAPPRILVVDDEPDVEALITQHFRHEIRRGELAFAFAGDGRHALRVLDDDPDFAIVMSDINMPGMDGLELLSRLADKHRNLRTVMVSAYGDLPNIRTAMNRGAFDFVTKPIEFDDLRTTISRTLTNLSDHRELLRQRAEAELARATLARFFSPSVASLLGTGQHLLEPGGARREATFLFTDLTGFTALVERTAPDLIVELLNGYIDGVAALIFRHDGTVMKVIGDAIQAIFGAPVAQPDHPARALACALEIDGFARSFAARWRDRGVELGATRVGVNSGEAVIGNFGGESFFDYTAYGDAVNVAARLQAANKTLGTRICVSATVADAAPDVPVRPAGRLRLAGKSDALRCFEPLAQVAATAPEVARYRDAYDLLDRGDPRARSALAALLGDDPDDPLTLFHLRRALAGAIDTVVDVTAK